MKTWTTIEHLQLLIDMPIGELRSKLSLGNSNADAKIAYNHLTKGELVIKYIQKYHHATNDDERT